MKKLFILSFFTFHFSFFTHCFAQTENEIRINPKIKNVTVFLNGAEIKQTEDVEVKRGTNRIVIEKLSAYMDVKSVQASIDGGGNILSVSTQSNFLSADKLTPQIKEIKDSIALLTTELSAITDELDAYTSEKNMLNENKNIGNKQAPTPTTELDKTADYFYKKIMEIDNAMTKLNKKSASLNAQLLLMNNELSELNYKNNAERKEVVVVVNSNSSQHITVNLRYLVSNTGWEPAYDLVATDISQPIELKYKARAYNNTGIDWNNVNLTFSTANPTLSASRPYLAPWTLKEAPQLVNEQTEAYRGGMADSTSINLPLAKAEVTTDNAVQYKTITLSELSTSFNIPNPYTIPSDAKPYTVDITTYTLPATYGYVSVPKLDNSAFLVAKISGWEKLYLIDGPMNVYFNNAYIGASNLNTQRVEDTLELSLGRDNQIQVSRVKKEDFGSKSLIGSSRKTAYKYEITVKNNKSTAINMEILDQVPVSQESDITVDVDQISGAKQDNTTGALTWQASLKPGESITYNLSFSVKYPKNKVFHIEEYKMRAMECPSF